MTTPPASGPIIDLITRRLSDLTSHSIPRLRASRGPLSLQQDLAREIVGDMARVERMIEELEEIAEDQDDELERMEILEVATRLGGETVDARKSYRSALLESKRAIDANPNARREELLYSRTAKLDSNQTTDDPLQEKANQVTASLRQTTELMKEELDRSVLTSQMLDESTATLRSTTTLYQAYSTLMETSQSLLTALESANYMDRILILGALFFFLLCCAWVLKRRIFDRAVGGVSFLLGRRAVSKTAIGEGAKAAVEAVLTTGASVTNAAAVSIAAGSAAAASATSSSFEAAIKGQQEEKKQASSTPLADELLPPTAAETKTGTVKDEL